MKIFIILILSCASVLGEDTDIRFVTMNVRTNNSGSVITKDIFTRDGQTNLVRYTSTKSGAVQMRINLFYYHGLLAGNFVANSDSVTTYSEPGFPYQMDFLYGPNKDVKAAFIASGGGCILDAFTATNGVFYPVDSVLIRKANENKAGVSMEDFPEAFEQLGDKRKGK